MPKQSPQLHAQELESLQDLVENANDLIHSLRPDGSFLYVNRMWCATLGYSPEEAEHLTIQDIIHPASRNRPEAWLSRVFAGEQLHHVEATLLAKDGRAVAVEGSINCHFDEHGAPLATRAIFRDLSARQQAEALLRTSAERFRFLVEMSSDAIFLADGQGGIHYASPAIVRVLGYAPEELLGTSGLALVHPDDLDLAQVILQRRVETAGEHVPFLLRARHRDGSWRWLDGVCTNHLDEPAVRAIVVNYRDVTESKQAQEALRESEERFRNVVEHGLHGIVVHQNDVIQYANPAAVAMFGYDSTEELLGRNVFETLVAPEDRVLLRGRRDAALRGEKLRLLPSWRGVRKDGQLLWASGIASRISWQGAPAAVSIVDDVTERKQAEEALRESEERYRSLVELAQDAILILEDECIVYCNPMGLNLLGAPSPEELLGKPIGPFFHPEDRPLAAARRQMILQTAQPVPPRVFRLQRFDHQQIDIESYGAPCLYQGRPALQVVFRDVTGRQHAEEALRQSEQRLQTLARFVPVGLFQTDAQGECVYVNERWCEHAGMTPALAQGRGWVAALHPEDHARVFAEWIQAAKTGSEFHSDYRFHTPAGKVTWLHGSAVALRDPAGTVTGFLGSITDITERRRAEAERRQLEAQMQHAQKLESLGVLAGGIAHDFNNLLTAVLGNASLALMQLPDESLACPLLREIENAAQRAAELTQQMLAYSGRGRFIIMTLRLDALVQEMTKLLGTVVSKKAALNLNLAPSTIEGDPTQVRQVVMNLITNASDALDGQVGAISVRTGVREVDAALLRSPFLHEDLPAGRYAFVQVEDNGCGMTEETQSRIFDPFFTTKFTGRGLGLAAVLGIVKGHKGTIKVDSAPGRGTVFQVLFPCAADLPGASLQANPAGSALRGRGTVLVVEDEASLRTFTRRALESAGFQAREAADGRQGLELWGQHRQEIVAILLDLTMPRMDGLEMLGELRRLDPNVPVLVMSGYSEAEVALRFEGKGASGFIQKPFHPRDLIARVCQLLPDQAPPSGR